MWETYLKATGWKSEYKSVQRLLNHLARRIRSEGSRECYLSWLYRYCRKVGKDPEEVVASEPLWIRESMQDFVDDAGAKTSETGNLARAALTAFLKSNGFDGSEKNAVRIKGFFTPARKTIEMTDYERQVITLATEDWTTFFHELAHSLHRSFEAKTGHGQEPEAETVAQLVAATLARLYGKPDDTFSWTYIASQAQSNSPQPVGRLCMRVLDRAKKVLGLIYQNPPYPAVSVCNPYEGESHP